MLKQEDFLMIRHKAQQGAYLKDIAAELGIHPRTVRRALQRGGAPSRRRPGARRSKLDPFKSQVDALLAQGVWNAQVIFTELRRSGYEGGYSILCDYIRPKRSLQPSKATVRFETRPGHQLQHDWGELMVELDGQPTRVNIAVNVLGYSRQMHVYAAPAQDAEHTYESLVRAFEAFSGAPAEVLVDNQKAAVLKRENGRVVFNPRFLDLAGHYGFQPRACRPYRARTKGKTERMVGYLKDHFFAGHRSFQSFADLNHQLEQWLDEEANRRRHRTHGEIIRERFQRDEQPTLTELPRQRFDTAYLDHRLVAWDGYVEVRGNRYSVPDTLCGQSVRIRVTLQDELQVIDAQERIVAEHLLALPDAGWQRQTDHHRRLWREALQVEQRGLEIYEEVAS